MKHAVSHGKIRDRPGRPGDQLALDGEGKAAARTPGIAPRPGLPGRRGPRGGAAEIVDQILIIRIIARVLLEAAAVLALALRALPARRAVARAEMRHLVET